MRTEFIGPRLLAYLAGIIDADGYIGIKRRAGNDHAATYSERMCVKQVTNQAIDLLAQTFGGSRYSENPSAKNGRILQVWQITDRKAFDAISAIRPFLTIKTAQADVCHELRALKIRSQAARMAIGRGHVGADCRPNEISEAMESCYLRIKELNHVGC